MGETDQSVTSLLAQMTQMIQMQQQEMKRRDEEMKRRDEEIKQQKEEEAKRRDDEMKKKDEELFAVKDILAKPVDRERSGEVRSDKGPDKFSLDAIENRLQLFEYNPDEDKTFENWWDRNHDIFEEDLKDWEEVQKVRFLMRHVSPAVETQFSDSIAPKKPSEHTISEIVELLKKQFGDKTSIFDRRRRMLDIRMSKDGINDITLLASRVNKAVTRAQFKDIKLEEMKCLIFLHALDLQCYSDVLIKMLDEAERKKDAITLEDLIAVYNRYTQLKRESKAVTNSTREIYAVKKHNPKEKTHPEKRHNSCYRCGDEGHYSRQCKFKGKCDKCGRNGHKAIVCKQDEEEADEYSQPWKARVNTVHVPSSQLKKHPFGVDIEVDGRKVHANIDTGSDITILTEDAWMLIGRPVIKTAMVEAVAPNGTIVPLRGRTLAQLSYGGRTVTKEVHIGEGSTSILGRDVIDDLQLLIFAPVKEERGEDRSATSTERVVEKEQGCKTPVAMENPKFFDKAAQETRQGEAELGYNIPIVKEVPKYFDSTAQEEHRFPTEDEPGCKIPNAKEDPKSSKKATPEGCKIPMKTYRKECEEPLVGKYQKMVEKGCKNPAVMRSDESSVKTSQVMQVKIVPIGIVMIDESGRDDSYSSCICATTEGRPLYPETPEDVPEFESKEDPFNGDPHE